MRNAVFLLLLLGLGREAIAGLNKVTLISGKLKMQLEESCERPTGRHTPAVIFLHGSGGPGSKNIPYRRIILSLERKGYCVFVPHYLDATRGEASNPQGHYRTWVDAIVRTMNDIESDQVALVGYSLGASVALASARDQRVRAVIEFSGSLPDEYFRTLKSLPPLLIFHEMTDVSVPAWNAKQLAELCDRMHLTCDVNIWPDEGHVFSEPADERAGRLAEQFLARYLPVH